MAFVIAFAQMRITYEIPMSSRQHAAAHGLSGYSLGPPPSGAR